MNFNTILEQVLAKQDLTHEQMTEMMSLTLAGKMSDARLSALLIALRSKGESVEELFAAAQVVRQFCTAPVMQDYYLVDTCGSGGDGSSTLNISTLAAIVAAAAGVKIAKHGNRAVSGCCGSADFLEAAGVVLALDAKQVMECIEEVGIGFLFAPCFHQAMRFAGPVRKELGVKTMFNLLGPLSNPLTARAQLIGVYDESWLAPMIEVVGKLGLDRSMVVHSEDHLDEISIFAPTQVMEWKNGVCTSYSIQPEDFFEQRYAREDIVVSSAEESLELGRQVLRGEAGAPYDIVVLNAAGVIYLSGIAQDIAQGVELARQVIDSGRAYQTLEQFVALTQKLGK